MKKFALVALALTVLGARCFAAEQAKEEKGEVLTLVEIQDSAKEISYKLLNPAEVKQLQNELKIEAKFKPKILATAEKEWKSDADRAKKPFPKSAIADRKVTSKGTFTDREKGEKKVTDLEDRESTRKDREKEARKGAKVDERAEARATEKEDLNNQAREIYAQKLDEIVKSLEKPAEAAAPAEGEKPAKEEKPDDAKAEKPADDAKAEK
jgi:hypothetical protein